MSSGTTASIRSSRDPYPSTSTISATSPGRGPTWRDTNWSGESGDGAGMGTIERWERSPSGRRAPGGLLPNVLLVGRDTEQRLELPRLLQSQLDHPTCSLVVVIDQARVLLERAV